MVVDTSALIAVAFLEPGFEALEAALVITDRSVISAATLLEASMVVNARRGQSGLEQLDQLLSDLAIDTVAVDSSQAFVARDAFIRYGKGNHAAGLNFGDCFSYALAKTRDEPLLFKGDDFSQTDVAVAGPPAGWR
jgi:ribonuclease VapC